VPVTIVGNFTHFSTNSSITLSGTGITPTNILATSNSQLNATLVVDPHAPAGARTLSVTTGTEKVTQTFTVTPASLALSPASLRFGIQQLGTTSGAQTVTVTNSGTASLTLTSIGIAGANSSDFNQTNNCPLSPSTFAPAATCQLSVTFAPTASGPRKSAINVQDNSGDSLSGLLTGVGTAVGLSPASLTFPSQSVGTSGTPQTVTLSNSGSSPMNIWQIALRGANAADFSKSTTCGATLAAGNNCGITVTFTPSAAGTRSASLLISEDGGGSPQSVSLSGTGSGDPPAPSGRKRKREL
jgi:hypothetical protein